MANNKMLIDASHPEETRVAVVRGNRIEEFDFESQAKRQLRGNIYLAKVTRVEPSLQAAFVDYGGNRHGFLAFNEIHPDYYQIPTADRQALLDEEAMAAEEDGDGDAVPVSAEPDDEADEGGKKKKRTKRSQSRGKRGRKAKDKTDEAGEDSTAPAAEDEASAGDSVDAVEAAAAEPAGEADDGDVADEAPQQAEIEAADEADQESAEDAVAQDDAEHDDTGTGDENDEDEEDRKGGSIAAIVETDSISEPAPEDETPDDVDDSAAGDDAELKESVEAQASGDEAAAAEEPAEAEAPKKPRRRTTRRKPAKAAEKADDAETADADPAEAVAEQAETEAEDSASDDAEKTDAPEETGDRPSRSRRSTRGRRRSNGDDENGDDDEDEKVESVGSEDALEEVPYRRTLRRQYKIQEVVKRRQVMLVQVVKEERGNKGAALTTYLSLAGRYSVLMPNTARGGGISRKITNANDRKRLKSIAAELDVPSGMGVILRTAGASRTKAEIKRDFEYLMRLWENVRNLTLTSNAPCLVYEEGSLIKRSIRDLYDKNIGEVLVSGDDGYREAKEFMRMLMPSHAKNVKQYDEDQAIFSRHGVEQQLERLLSPQVTLKSGGYLVINQTEALVSIDVNSGRSTREHSIEDTALATNLEAAEEIARQLRLRDLAGLIVIDFIDMEEKRNNRSVEKRLKEALKSDRARIQVGRVSHFGLLEMSRQRIRASVIESTMEVCPHCQGTGHVRSDSSIALHIFRAIEDHAMRHSRHDVVVRCPTVIAIDILNTKRAGLIEIEHRLGLQVQILADASLPGQSFNIEKGEPASGAPSRPAHVQMDSAPPLETELDDEAEALAAEPVDDGDDDDGGRKKRRRRRGKRGGRRNRGDAAEASDASAEAESDESEGEDDAAPADVAEEAVAAADDAQAETTDDSPAETEASDAEVAEVADNGSEATAAETESLEEEPADEEPAASPRGRNTRRPRKTARTADDDNGGGNGSAEEALTAEVPSDATDGDDDGSKRSGWWNRGGGFF